ncbi:MAG: exopolysaccharide biosynthesis protein [Candidatus Saccharimonadales bacterium]
MSHSREGRSQTPDFSETLNDWLANSTDKSLAGLNRVFAEKTFAIALFVLMALPALPLPTGGVTHVIEIITMLLCLELIAGRRSVWLPRRWQKIDVGKVLAGKAAGRLIAFIQWFERRSARRWSGLLSRRPTLSAAGLIMFIFTAAAFLAPPFSGLDTLPAFGVVVMSLGLILEDGLIVLVGIIAGIAGIGLEIAAGAALYDGARHLFKYL